MTTTANIIIANIISNYFSVHGLKVPHLFQDISAENKMSTSWWRREKVTILPKDLFSSTWISEQTFVLIHPEVTSITETNEILLFVDKEARKTFDWFRLINYDVCKRHHVGNNLSLLQKLFPVLLTTFRSVSYKRSHNQLILSNNRISTAERNTNWYHIPDTDYIIVIILTSHCPAATYTVIRFHLRQLANICHHQSSKYSLTKLVNWQID